MTVPQWEFMYVQAPTNMMKQVMENANKLGAVGWEPVGIASADKTIGINSNVLIMKRRIEFPPPLPTTGEHWQPDPTGRFDQRRFDPSLGVWTAEVATMATKKVTVDPPHMVTPLDVTST